MLVCFLLKRTSGHLNSKDFLRMFLMTRAKEQATLSLKTNSMSVNRVEYKIEITYGKRVCTGFSHELVKYLKSNE